MNTFLIKEYIKYLLKAKDAYALHSPFVFELYTKIIHAASKDTTSIKAIEQIRAKFLKSHQLIDLNDLGAGSKSATASKRSLKKIAKNSLKKPHLANLLYRLIAFFQPSTIVELGTSVGITTAYLAIHNLESKIYTFEGDKNLLQIAQENFKDLKLKNITAILGNIDQTLPATISSIEKLDFAFFDANHRYQPTINYFEICLTKAHEFSIFIFDDIYWSKDMKKAWETIKNYPQVTLSIDLFWLGLIFFRKKQPIQHFILKM